MRMDPRGAGRDSSDGFMTRRSQRDRNGYRCSTLKEKNAHQNEQVPTSGGAGRLAPRARGRLRAPWNALRRLCPFPGDISCIFSRHPIPRGASLRSTLLCTRGRERCEVGSSHYQRCSRVEQTTAMSKTIGLQRGNNASKINAERGTRGRRKLRITFAPTSRSSPRMSFSTELRLCCCAAVV
jgi:hypothetical protein